MGRIVIIVAPHERQEVVDVYKDRLTPTQIESILTAPDNEFIKIRLGHFKRWTAKA